MKSFIVALCIGVIMVGGCVLYMMEVEDISDELKNLNKKIIESVKTEEYREAEQRLKKLSEYFEGKIIMLAATGNHTELDQIQIYISQVDEYIKEEQKGDALAFCESLDIMFCHLPKNYRLRPENIL